VEPWGEQLGSALAVGGSTVYAGGLFTYIGGEPEPRRYVAALDASTGRPTAWNPGANDGVFALALSGSTVYAGGGFSAIGGQNRKGFAAISDLLSPVEVSDLSAEQVGRDALLHWRTTHESELQAFRVLRARVDGPFQPLSPDVRPNADRAYAFRDPSPEPGRYIYRIGEVDLDGAVVLLGWVEVQVERQAPWVAILHPAFPNPFNAKTTLRFDLARDGEVALEVVDVRGRTVRSLVRAWRVAAGEQRVVWDGLDDRGRRVVSGVYEARLRVDGSIWTRRVTLLK